MTPKAILAALVGTLALSACTQSAVRLRETENLPPVRILVPHPAAKVADDLEAHLRSRRRFESKRMLLDTGGIAFVQPWIRDSSLRYYLLNFDQRLRHVADWKAEWIVQPMGPSSAQVELRVLEVIFMGVPWSLRPRPDPEEVQQDPPTRDWFETEPDHLRAALEARRFWMSTYPLLPLPERLAGLRSPSLEGPPRSREFLKPRWTPLERRRSF